MLRGAGIHFSRKDINFLDPIASGPSHASGGVSRALSSVLDLWKFARVRGDFVPHFRICRFSCGVVVLE